MNKLAIGISTLVLGLALVAGSCSSSSEVPLSLENPSDQDREDTSVRLLREEIEQWAKVPGELLPFLKDENGTPIPCQADDVDGDGSWDEVFAQVTLAAGEQKRIYLDFVLAEDYPVFPQRTNIRVGDASSDGYPDLEQAGRLEGISYHNYNVNTQARYQMEGVAWENDRVGFRNYLDQRNGMDIFGKLITDLVLDSVGIKGTPSYHEPADWGMDVLKVGTSLGAGSLAYMYKDSLYRLGDNGPGSFMLVFEGTQRSQFALDYSEWKAGDKSCEVKQLIEIAAGRHYYQGTVTNSCSNMDLAVGIVNMHSDSLHVIMAGEQHMALYTLDHQSEDGSMLGMALLVPNEVYICHDQCPDEGNGITSSYYALLDASGGGPLSYRFYSLWEKENPRWSNEENVEAFLEEEGKRWTQSELMEVRK